MFFLWQYRLSCSPTRRRVACDHGRLMSERCEWVGGTRRRKKHSKNKQTNKQTNQAHSQIVGESTNQERVEPILHFQHSNRAVFWFRVAREQFVVHFAKSKPRPTRLVSRQQQTNYLMLSWSRSSSSSSSSSLMMMMMMMMLLLLLLFLNCHRRCCCRRFSLISSCACRQQS